MPGQRRRPVVTDAPDAKEPTMKRFATLFVLALALAFAGAVAAVPLTFETDLVGSEEVPPVVTPGAGVATIVIDADAHTLSLDVLFTNLIGPTTAAHIHCCQPFGTNAGVATEVPSFTGFPLGVMSGTFLATFDTTLASTFNPTFVTNNGGTVATAEAALFAGIAAGLAYLNIHTDPTAVPPGFGGGEIRGQLRPAQVPEPASIALFAVALLLLFGMRRRPA
jgi:hypothetical protein